MSLEQIVRDNAAFVTNSNVKIEINSLFSWVDIFKIDERIHNNIFLQGHEAETFITEIKDLSEKLPDVNFDILEKHIAYPYLDLLSS